MKIFEFPVNPFPGFHWFILVSVILLGVTVNPDAIKTTIIWSAVVSYNICNIVCVRVVDKKFTILSRARGAKYTWMDLVMFFPFVFMTVFPPILLQKFVTFLHETLLS